MLVSFPAFAAPPVAPANFSVRIKNVSGNLRHYAFTWDDSPNETSYKLQIKVIGVDPDFVDLIPNLPQNSNFEDGTINQWNAGITLQFRLLAVNGEGSSASAIATIVTAADVANIAAPSSLAAVPASDSQLNLSWVDNSHMDDGVELELQRLPNGPFEYLGDRLFLLPPSVSISSLTANTSYKIRLKAYRVGSGNTRTYSSSVEVVGTTAAFSTVPTNFVATAASENSVQYSWVDPFLSESGFEVQGKITGEPVEYVRVNLYNGNPPPGAPGHLNPIVTTPDGPFFPGMSYDFRVRAVSIGNGTIDDQSTWVYSAPSNISTVQMPFHRPTGLTAPNAGITESSATLNWTDNSATESGYDILIKYPGESQYTYWDEVAANQTTYNMTGLPPGVGVQVAVRAFFQFDVAGQTEFTFSALSDPLIFTTKDTFPQPQFQGLVGQNLSHPMTVTTGSPRVSWSASALPGWLSFDSNTGVFSGTPPSAGVFQVPVSATFQNGWVTNKTVTIRTIHAPGAPVEVIPQNQVAMGLGAVVEWDLGLMFSDPDTPSAVRVNTNLGNYHMALYPEATPLTVSNFLAYVNDPNPAGNYNDSIFHRLIPGFVVQAGGYKVPNTPYVLTSIASRPDLQNESGLTNVRGTVAMAKFGGDPDSATSQFFINLVDNSDGLDATNGGFTVFGRVVGPMTVPDLLSTQPTSDRTVTIDGASGSVLDFFPDLPVSPPAPVTINSITSVPVLNFAMTNNSNPAVVAVTLQDDELQMTSLSPGQSTVTYTVTDLDGNVVTREVSVLVRETVDEWLLAGNLPVGQQGFDDDADFDGLTNIEEFAFMGSVLQADDASVRPTAVTVDVSGTDRQGIQFNARKFGPGLKYVVEVSGNLSAASWEPVWSWTADSWPPQPGVETAAINLPTRFIDHDTHYEFKILDPVPVSVGNPRFLRVRLIKDSDPD
ncbi:peptidylprolyl isomerase [Phragmitibacter flavus]|uniref:peptidylprolyl isomerase n=1 Tax=Phragmitibacter flavus TaxID=2576071 RepID=UPI0019826E77|nr:peptidylprolyl isomerase [Phragmitibacter flavus]